MKCNQSGESKIDFKNEFDLCALLSGTFGFFSEIQNQQLLNRIYDALTAGGYIFIMYISANRTDLNSKKWKEIDNGYQLTKTWFEQETSTFHSTARLILDSGEIIMPRNEAGYHANEVIRCYTPPEISSLLTASGFGNIVHLGTKHLDNPNAVLDPGDIREIVVARKE